MVDDVPAEVSSDQGVEHHTDHHPDDAYVVSLTKSEPAVPAATAVAAEPEEPADRTDDTDNADGTRRGLWLAVLAAVVVLIAGGIAVASLKNGGASTTGPSTSTSPSAGATTDPVDVAPPVTLPADGSYVSTQVLSSDDLRVTHWIHSSTPLSRITLVVPPVPGLDASQVSVSNLTIAGDGTALADSPRVGAKPTTVSFPAARDVYVSYDLGGVVDKAGTDPGRALARILSLSVRYPTQATLSTTQAVTGAHVLGLACTADSESAQPVACGAPQQGVWQTQASGDAVSQTVMAQLDLSAD